MNLPKVMDPLLSAPTVNLVTEIYAPVMLTSSHPLHVWHYSINILVHAGPPHLGPQVRLHKNDAGVSFMSQFE